MFLTHPQQTKDNFKENIKNLLDDCLNSRNKINHHQLPEILLAGDAAWLIVCSQNQEPVVLDNDETFEYLAKEAARIHRRIQSKYYQEFKGIEQVDIALDFEGTAHLNFTITKEAFLEYLNSNDKYRQLLEGAHISSGTIPENPTQQIFVQMIQNNVDLTLAKTNVINNIDARTINNTEISYQTKQKATSSRTRSNIKDAASIALKTIILPALKKENISFEKEIELAKLCWERLPDALREIGCTNIKLDANGAQDNNTIQANHETLNKLRINFKSFRQRIVRLFAEIPENYGSIPLS